MGVWRSQSKQRGYYCFTHCASLTSLSPAAPGHRVWSLVLIGPRTSLKNNTRLSSVLLPPTTIPTWKPDLSVLLIIPSLPCASCASCVSCVSCVNFDFLFSSRQWCFRDPMMLNTRPNRNVYLLKEPDQIFPKACVPAKMTIIGVGW